MFYLLPLISLFFGFICSNKTEKERPTTDELMTLVGCSHPGSASLTVHRRVDEDDPAHGRRGSDSPPPLLLLPQEVACSRV